MSRFSFLGKSFFAFFKTSFEFFPEVTTFPSTIATSFPQYFLKSITIGLNFFFFI